MPPKPSGSSGRSRPKGSKARSPPPEDPDSSDPFDSSDDKTKRTQKGGGDKTGEVERAEEELSESFEKSIPRDLLTRILHEFFAKDSTRISRDANAAVGKYVDIFLREAIARAAVEKKGGFLEVEDLEKIAPQLLLDL